MANFVKLSCSTFNPQPKFEKVIKIKKGLSYKKKPTGEKDIFEKIFEERGPYSQISGAFLGEYNVSFFAHILPKGQNKYPHFKLIPENIILMTIDEHHCWDNARHKCIDLQWNWIYFLENTLKEKYKILHPSK